MSDDQENPLDKRPQNEPEGPVGGERLAEARREQRISVLDIAKELHLDEPKVRALEQNDFDVLGAPVFAKGHLRKYAQLVGVDVDDVFADYYRLTRSTGMPPIVTGRTKGRRELPLGPWIAVIIVVLAAALAYWLLSLRSPVAATPPPATQDAEPASNILVEYSDTVLIAAAVPGDEPVTTQTLPAPVEQTLADGELRLSVSFSGDCWTEITDADGSRLFFGMGRRGQTVNMSGRAPFSVLFGKADNVEVRVNDSPYTISTADQSNRTVRLTILNP